METIVVRFIENAFNYLFLPYLWGMETFLNVCHFSSPPRSYRTYEEWKPCFSASHSFTCVSFLPYLWGMETEVTHAIRVSWRCSYRTYEEWKPRSYGFLSLVPFPSSYRTYEEWKLMRICLFLWFKQRFLPYLWGMETCKTQPASHRDFVLTVPMRNGNSCNFPLNKLIVTVLTVPMRNGNFAVQNCLETT